MLKCIGFVVFALFATITHAGVAQVESVRFWTAPDHSRLVFDLSSTVRHHLMVLDDPDRVVIDMADTHLEGRLRQPSASHPVIKRIRSARRNGTGLRVVLDLKSAVKPKSFVLQPKGPYGHRLVVDLYDKTERRQPARAAEKRNKPATARRNRPEQKGRRRQTVPPRRRSGHEYVIAIDAGHGGEDPGAHGVKGTREKDVVLSIARQLAALIRKQPGMRPVMIRTGDYYVSLRQRIRAARKAKADLFISIHADAFEQRQVRGSSVYTLSERGASSEAARWLAARENASDLVGGVSLDDKDDLLASVLLDLSQTATREASQEVAAKVLANLRGVGRLHKRQVQHAGFVVLKSPDIPSILVETAFISNPHEEANLRSKRHQARLAGAIFKGVRDYFGARGVPAQQVAVQEHVISAGDTLSEIAQRYGVSLKQLQRQNELEGSRIRVGQVLKIPQGS